MNQAQKAVNASYKFECKKDGLRQNQDGSAKVTFNIHPDDMPADLWRDPMGQRYMAVLVPLEDDETPRDKNKGAAGSQQPNGFVSHGDDAPRPEQSCDKSGHPHKKRWGELSYAERAGIVCNDPQFYTFLRTEDPDRWMEILFGAEDEKSGAAQYIREYCGVDSRADLAKSPKAAEKFEYLHGQFRMWLQHEAGDAA